MNFIYIQNYSITHCFWENMLLKYKPTVVYHKLNKKRTQSMSVCFKNSSTKPSKDWLHRDRRSPWKKFEKAISSSQRFRNTLNSLLPFWTCLIKVERGWLSYIIKRWNIILWTYLSIVTSIFLVQGCLHSKRRQNWTVCHVQRKSKTSLYSYLIALFLSAKFK